MTDGIVEIQQGDDRVRVELAGEIDMSNADAIGERIYAAIPNQTVAVEVDLTDVTYVDSAGLRVLSLLSGRLQRLQIRLRVLAPTGSPARYVIDLSGMTEFVNVELSGPPDAPPAE
jgi:anti-anti-sigma factor